MQMFWILAGLSTLSALAYGLHYVHQSQSLTRTLCKTLPIGCLAVISALFGAPLALTLALAFGTLGDIFLSRDGERFFLFGLGAFLIGHLFYIALLAALSAGIAPFVSSPWRIIASLVLLGTATAIVKRLLPHLGALRRPVLVYVVVIIAMGLTALSLPASWPLSLAIFGAILFTASDAILGLELFAFKDDPSPRLLPATLLWFLYWSGQFLILLAVLPI